LVGPGKDLGKETSCQLVEAGQLILSQVEDLDDETCYQLEEAGQLILSQVRILVRRIVASW